VSDPASTRAVAYAQVRVREPLGERVLGESVSIGGPDPQGTDPDVVVPGAAPGRALTIERRKAVWVVEPAARAVRFNGKPLTGARDLNKNDTLSLGDAQIVVTDVSRTLLRVDAHHLAGNATIAPAATLATLVIGDGEDEDVEIHPLETLRVSTLAAKAANRAPARSNSASMLARHWLPGALATTVLLVAFVISSLLQTVSLDIYPADAHVLTPGTLWVIHQAGHLLLLPGKHVVRAERDGYYAAQKNVEVRSDDTATVRLRLEKLPGKLHIDTGGIDATVSVDGLEVGHAPGVLSVPAGTRTMIVTAPHYVDYITSLTVAGAGKRQDLRINLQTSWGALQVLSIPEGGHVSVDGIESGAAPVIIQAPSGVRRIQIAAPGHKTWESSVVLRAGETLKVGPVTLGQPDAHLTVRSDPPGADATVAGTHLGRTPAEIDLPSGIAHQVVLSAPGYKNWVRAVFADPGHKLAVFARLEPIVARVSVRGDPADAVLVVDGVARGKTPQSLDLSATEHRIEVRKNGFQPFNSVVTPAAGLDRTVQYHLVPVGSTNTPR
jgi:hypothetical protein